MRYLELDGQRISRIGLGTWQFGSREWGYGAHYARREAGAIVRRALDLGINLIDTAEVYAFGRSERIVGAAIGGRRAEAWVATKVFPVMPVEAVVVARGRASARRLGMQRVDLYQVHWPNPLVPLSTTMAGMRRLQDDGTVDQVGVSNFDLAGWLRAEQALGRAVLSNQVRYNLLARGAERELLGYAAGAGRLVIAHSPLARGLLSAKYSADHRPGGLRAADPVFTPDNLERAAPVLDTLREVAAAHDASPAQVALAWVVRRTNVVAIPGAASVAQLEANAAAADLDLTDGDDAALTAASDAFTPATGPAALPAIARRLLRGR